LQISNAVSQPGYTDVSLAIEWKLID